MRIPDYGNFPPMDCIESNAHQIRVMFAGHTTYLPWDQTECTSKYARSYMVRCTRTRDRRPASGCGLGRDDDAVEEALLVDDHPGQLAVRDRRAVRPGGDQLEAHQPPVHVDDRGSTGHRRAHR